MFLFAAQPAVAAQADLGEARHALDIEMQQVAGAAGAHSAATGGGGFRSRHRLSRARRRMRLTEAALNPVRRAIS